MEIESFLQTFLQNTFSVGVAAFLLLRVERELRLLRNAIMTLQHCPTCAVSPWEISLRAEIDKEKEDKADAV